MGIWLRLEVKFLVEASTNGIPPPRPCILCKFQEETNVFVAGVTTAIVTQETKKFGTFIMHVDDTILFQLYQQTFDWIIDSLIYF